MSITSPFPQAALGRLDVRDLACRRGGPLVFAGLSFTVEPGGAVLLRGPNGSGKSTLLRCLAGLLRPEAGAITWNDRPIGEDPEAHRRRLRYLGHQEAVKPQLGVAENLAFGTALAGAAKADIDAGLRAFGIDRLADLPARYLSAGQRRRLALARVAAVPAPLWLLDEPLSGLDDAAIGLLEATIARHRAAGGMLVLSAHGAFDLPDAGTLDLARFAPARAQFADGAI